MKPQNISPSISYNSVEQLPLAKCSVIFIEDSSKVFKDDIDITPRTLSDGTKYIPWGGDNDREFLSLVTCPCGYCYKNR